METPHIIAEIGSNHNGNLETAKQLIDIAVGACADSVKFQIINTEGLYLPGKYEFGHYNIDEVRAFREKTKFSDEEYFALAQYAKSKNSVFVASIFDLKGLELLLKLNPPFIKIASTDLNNLYLLKKVSERGIQMIISTGMSELFEIDKTVNFLLKNNFSDIVLMHCVSSYPAKLEEMNLEFIDELKSKFGLPVGLSDHTKSSIAACLALTKGIKFIEKHITLDCTQEGLDHAHAADPNTFVQYVTDIKNACKALNQPENKIGDNERYVKIRARRSLYAARDISAGEIITEKDILIVRPSNEMTADQIFDVIGRKTAKTIYKHQPLSISFFEKEN